MSSRVPFFLETRKREKKKQKRGKGRSKGGEKVLGVKSRKQK